jgi:hypothetical protein
MELKKAPPQAAASSKASHRQNSDGTYTVTHTEVNDYGDEVEVVRTLSKEEYAVTSKKQDEDAL